MLGSMVFQYLAQNENLNVIGTARDLSYWRGKKVIKLAVENFNEETFIKINFRNKTGLYNLILSVLSINTVIVITLMVFKMQS